MIHSQTDARRLFVDKVETQARMEGVSLSAAERQMLSWSESDADSVVDAQLPERLAAEISAEEYETKITGLLARRFAAEVAAAPAVEAEWNQAAQVLRQGDHYILVMLDAAIGSRLKRWWRFWR